MCKSYNFLTRIGLFWYTYTNAMSFAEIKFEEMETMALQIRINPDRVREIANNQKAINNKADEISAKLVGGSLSPEIPG